MDSLEPLSLNGNPRNRMWCLPKILLIFGQLRQSSRFIGVKWSRACHGSQIIDFFFCRLQQILIFLLVAVINFRILQKTCCILLYRIGHKCFSMILIMCKDGKSYCWQIRLRFDISRFYLLPNWIGFSINRRVRIDRLWLSCTYSISD